MNWRAVRCGIWGWPRCGFVGREVCVLGLGRRDAAEGKDVVLAYGERLEN